MTTRKVRFVATVITCAFCFAISWPTATLADSDAIENFSAIVASESVCGFKVNQQMLEVAVVSLFGDPSRVAPGGELYPEVERNFARIAALTDTPEGRASFCNRVKTEMSAFYD